MKRYISRVTLVTPREDAEHPIVDQLTHVETRQFPISEKNIDDMTELYSWVQRNRRKLTGEWGAFIEVYPDIPSLEKYGKMFVLEYEADVPINSRDLADKVSIAVRLIESRVS